MRVERFGSPGDPRELARRIRELAEPPLSVAETVAEIIAEVRARGDAAVADYTRRFDTAGRDPAPLTVDAAALDAAAERMDDEVRLGLEQAIENVRRVAQARLCPERTVNFDRHEVVVREEPVERAAVYVPGGRAPYPSTVVMGVITAQIAGVKEVAVCAPPTAEGDIDPVVLGACRLTRASTVYRMGGAQAIAALAYGTESVGAVDAIVGPGNLYVQEAKRQVLGRVALDGFAGPSDLLVIATGDADPKLVTMDLLAQAEHGQGTIVVAVSPDRSLLDQIATELKPDSGAIACLVDVSDPEEALAISQAFAPEHLELIGEGAELLAPRATHAGCVFVGPEAGTAFGDYIVGSNHVLPTGGAARYQSMLGPHHFRRSFAQVRISDAAELAVRAAPIARAEGFELHARSMEARIRDNGSP